MRFKKIFVLLLGSLLFLLTLSVGCDTAKQNYDNIDLDKKDLTTWFDKEKKDLPSLEQCRKISTGMSLDAVIKEIGKPQRDVGYGAWWFQFDIDNGSVLDVWLDVQYDPNGTCDTYDLLYVWQIEFDYPDELVSLNELYPWINGLREADIEKVRYEQAYIGVAPGHLTNISYSTNAVDIQNTYRLLSSEVQPVGKEEGEVTGGGYVKYDFITKSNQTYSIQINNKRLWIENCYYKFVDKTYTFQFSELDCHSFITYSDEYEIYTYEQESVKIGNYNGLGKFEFQKIDGLIEKTPSYRLKSFDSDLLILSDNQFIIEGEENTVIYQITGEKDFSFLFSDL